MNIQSTNKVTSTTKKKPPHNKLLNILKVIPNKKESDKHLTVLTEDAGSNNLNTLGVSGNSPSNFGKEGESVRTYCFSTTVTFTSGGA